jgi:UDP-glucose 6-dehydrogenase
MVGNSIYSGLKNKGNDMYYYDPLYKESKMEDILDTTCCFISVPTIPNEKNECDLSILINVLDELKN